MVPLSRRADFRLEAKCLSFCVVSLWAFACPFARADETPPRDFAHAVAPILKRHCAPCHTDGTYKGGLSMDTRDDLIDSGTVVLGHPEESEIIARLTSEDPEKRMPPKGRPKLSAEEVQSIEAWIREGLPWEPGFTFAASEYRAPLLPRRPELPPASPEYAQPVDRIIDAYFRRRGIAWPSPLDDAAWLRRVYLDLIGITPSRSELEEFIGDSMPDKHARIVDALLARDIDYADHWLTFWNDLLRNDYAGTGYIDGGRKQISAWLYEALRTNMPYDRFVRALIHPTADSEGFIWGIKWRGNVNASQVREIQFSQNVSQVFLGINMKCASCHDSFIDHWTLKQAYGLGAIYATEPLEIHRCDKPTGEIARPAFLFPEIGEVDPDAPQPERLRQLADLMTSKQNGRLARTIVNRLWHRLMGRGLVHPVDAMGTRPWNEDLLDYLASDLIDHNYDLKHALRTITQSRIYRASCVPVTDKDREQPFVFRGPQAKRMTAEQFVDAVWRVTGTAPAKPDAPIPWDTDTPRMVRASLVKCDLLMRSLGRPNREQVVTSRPDQLTTLEAIELSNGEMLARLLARGAHRVLEEYRRNPRAIVEGLYWNMLARAPTEGERSTALELIQEPVSPEGVEDLLWVLLMQPEFQLIR